MVQLVAETGQDVRRHAQLFQLVARGVVFEQTHHHRLAVLGRHGGQAHVQAGALDHQIEAAVLRQAAFGNIHARHQLDPRHHRRRDAPIRHHLFVQHAVDAQTDAQHVFVRFDMDIRRTAGDCLFEQAVQQAHHRRIGRVVHLEQAIDVVLVGVLADVARQRSDLGAVPVAVVEHAQHVGLAHQHDIGGVSEQAAGFVIGKQVGRIGHADHRLFGAVVQQYHPVTACELLGNGGNHLRLVAVVAQIHHFHAKLLGEQRQQAILADEPQRDQGAAQLAAAALLFVQRDRQLLAGDDTLLDQQVAQSNLA